MTPMMSGQASPVINYKEMYTALRRLRTDANDKLHPKRWAEDTSTNHRCTIRDVYNAIK